MTELAFESIGAALRHRIVNYAAFIAFNSNTVKVYPQRLPQNPTIPAVTYEEISDVPYDDIGGAASLYRAIVEFKVWSKKSNEAADISEVLRHALQGYQGTNIGVRIHGIHHLHVMDDFEAEEGEYNKISRFSVFYRRVDP